MSLTSEEITAKNFKKFYTELLPYLGSYDKGKLTFVGEVKVFFAETAPNGFLICDGATYDKADYPELVNKLFSLTDTTPYVVSGDNTKFKVPDLRGEFLRGSGTNSHSNQGSGAGVGVHQDATKIPNFAVSQSNNRLYGYSTASSSNTEVQNADNTLTGKGYIRADGKFVSNTSQDAVYTSRPTNTSVLFCIAYKDTMVDLDFLSYGGERFAKSDMYDTTERVIGKWIDGKPLYQKVVDCGYLTGTNPKTVNSGIGNVDKIISLFGFMLDETNHAMYTMPFAHDESVQYNVWQLYDISSNTISLFYRGFERATTKAYLILKYTKTTDTADSFKYSTPTDYSTEEKIVGTWIDGKPSYQISYKLLSNVSITKDTWITIISSTSLSIISEIDVLEEVKICGNKIVIPHAIKKENNDIKIYLNGVGETISANDVITLQYTKTTD